MATRIYYMLLRRRAGVVALALWIQVPVWAQEAAMSDIDWAKIARMNGLQLAQGILNVRTDLKEYLTHDLTTTSGQYELLYDEVMGPCKRRKDDTEAIELCTGASLDTRFIDYLSSNRRICPDQQTGSCWKPALREHQMRDELFQLVKKNRGLLEGGGVRPISN